MKTKILIYAAMFGRPVISELFLMSCFRVKSYFKDQFEIDIFICCSDDESENLCKRYGVKYLVKENKPLGNKNNVAVEFALQNIDFDYLLLMGDDDIMSNELLLHYIPYIRDGYHYFGVQKIYFYQPSSNQAIHFNYQGKNSKLIGAGRMFSRQALAAAGYQSYVKTTARFNVLALNSPHPGKVIKLPSHQARYLQDNGLCETEESISTFALWEDEKDKGLDSSSELNMIFTGFFPTVVHSDKPLITDVKSRQNIWTYDRFTGLGAPVLPAEATAFFSEKEIEYVKKYL